MNLENFANQIKQRKKLYSEKASQLKYELFKLQEEQKKHLEKYEQDLKTDLSSCAKNISIEEVLNEISKKYFQEDGIKFADYSFYVNSMRTHFEKGQTLNFTLLNGLYVAEISPTKLILKTEETVLKSFKHKKAKEFYANLSDIILGVKEGKLF